MLTNVIVRGLNYLRDVHSSEGGWPGVLTFSTLLFCWWEGGGRWGLGQGVEAGVSGSTKNELFVWRRIGKSCPEKKGT